MDEVLAHLRVHPSCREALYLAVGVFRERTEQLNSPEPVTTLQRRSALLAPVATECSLCRDTWYSKHIWFSGMKITLTNPVGLQCQECRYTLCRDCLNRQQPYFEVSVAGGPCPTPGCGGTLTTPVLPTGRHDIAPLHPESIEGVIIVRDGPIVPTMGEALRVVTQVLPLLADDTDLIHIRPSAPNTMVDLFARDRLAGSLVHHLERDGVLAPGAWQRSGLLFLRPATGADDADYSVTVVRKSPRPGRDPAFYQWPRGDFAAVERMLVFYAGAPPEPDEILRIATAIERATGIDLNRTRISTFGGTMEPGEGLAQAAIVNMEHKGELPPHSLARSPIHSLSVDGARRVVAVVPASEGTPTPSAPNPQRSYAGLSAADLIVQVVRCRQAGRREDPSLRVILDELRRAYGHPAYPFAAALERLAFGTHGPALFQESMEPDEVMIVTAIMERLTGAEPSSG
ncbi:MAG: hypothetical protein ACRDP6_49610 [Actinoallomurus sp.]